MDQRKIWKLFLQNWHQIVRNEQVILAILALVIGIVVAYAAMAFRILLELLQQTFFGFPFHSGLNVLNDLSWWLILFVPTCGGLLIGAFLQFFMPHRRALGVADVIASGALHGGRMSLNLALKGALVNAFSIGVGASVGREGPVVHLGAAIAAWVSRRSRLSPSLSLTVLGCGVASAIAASFNAPIAGVFFALEVVIGHYALHTFTPIVVSAVAGTVISRIYFGTFPAFVIPTYEIASFLEFPAFILLGIVSAIAALVLMKSIMISDGMFDNIKLPVWLRPATGGLFVGVVALFLPEVLGVGYAATDAALKASLPLWLMLALIVAKTATTSISLGCRFGGGVFSPSLFVGAMVGGAFGIIAGSAFPELAASPGFYALIGMAAVAAPVIGAPISTIMIAFELTGEFSVVIAAMVAVALSSLICQKMVGRSFFHLQLQKRGLKIHGSRIQQLLTNQRVADMMSKEFEVISDKATLPEVRTIIENSPYSDFFVVDEHGKLMGMITFASLKGIAFDLEVNHLINARDIARPARATLSLVDEMDVALKRLESNQEDSLAVLNHGKVVGIIHYKDTLVAYNRALLQAQAAEHDEISTPRL